MVSGCHIGHFKFGGMEKEEDSGRQEIHPNYVAHVKTFFQKEVEKVEETRYM